MANKPSKPSASLNTLIQYGVALSASRVAIIYQAQELRDQARERDFDPRYYRLLTEEILRLERGRLSGSDLIDFASSFRDQDVAKARNFRECAEGYLKWRKAHQVSQVTATSRCVWSTDQMNFFVNPEMIALVDGERTIVNLHCLRPRSEFRVTKAELTPALHLLDLATRDARPRKARVAIIDVRRPAQFTTAGLSKHADIALQKELRGFASMWQSVESSRVGSRV